MNASPVRPRFTLTHIAPVRRSRARGTLRDRRTVGLEPWPSSGARSRCRTRATPNRRTPNRRARAASGRPLARDRRQRLRRPAQFAGRRSCRAKLGPSSAPNSRWRCRTGPNRLRLHRPPVDCRQPGRTRRGNSHAPSGPASHLRWRGTPTQSATVAAIAPRERRQRRLRIGARRTVAPAPPLAGHWLGIGVSDRGDQRSSRGQHAWRTGGRGGCDSGQRRSVRSNRKRTTRQVRGPTFVRSG